MLDHPVGADLSKLAEISQIMTKISAISGKPLPPFSIQKPTFQKPTKKNVVYLYKKLKKCYYKHFKNKK